MPRGRDLAEEEEFVHFFGGGLGWFFGFVGGGVICIAETAMIFLGYEEYITVTF